ncbi:MAG: tetratricopeptide repeat-containing sulfotransferase family protein [Phycisphaerales bacterium JB039]
MSDAALQALFGEASALIDRGDYFGAQQRLKRMLQIRPGEPNAFRLAARIAVETGQLERAIELRRKVCEAAPREPAFRVALGETYRDLGRFGEAIAQFDRALKLDKNHAGALGARAETLELQGKHEAAERLLRPVAERSLAPEIGAVWIRLLTRRGDLDEAISAGRAILEAKPKPTPALRHAAFALAAALEKAGDYAGALDAAARANATCAPNFDPARYRARIDELTDLFTRGAIAAMPRPAEPSDLPVLIVGMPRTGSTLIERIIDAHPKAFGAGERFTLNLLAGRLGSRTGSSRPYPRIGLDLKQEHVEGLAHDYLADHAQLAPRAERISNKDLSNLERLWLVAAALPRARVIYCLRDEVDTCLSCYMERLPTYAVPWASDFGHLALATRAHERLMAHWREATDLAIIDVRYEELVADQEAQSRRLIEFLGLDWDDACLRPHQVQRRARTLSHDQVTRPVYTSSAGRAERFGAALDPLRKALASTKW